MSERASAVTVGRERILRWWRAYHWWVLGALAVFTWALGFVGFRHYLGTRDRPGWDSVYLSLQLFVLESGSVPGPLPASLEIARLLAPLVAAYAVIAVVASIFRDEFVGLWTRFRRGHVIICGLDRGWSLARMLRAANERVVVIERDTMHPGIETARSLRIAVFVGDPRDEQLLIKTGVRRAARLVAVCGDDGVNMRVAEHARRLSIGRSELRVRPPHRPLLVLVHVDSPYLAGLLAMREMDRTDRGDARLDFFSLQAGGARALLSEFPLIHQSDADPTSPHLLIVGLDRLGFQLVVQAARQWHAEEHSHGERLWITIADASARDHVRELCERHPFVLDVCEIHDVDLPPDPLRLLRAPIFDLEGCPPVSSVFVCLPDDAEGLGVALALHRSMQHQRTPVVVRNYDADLGALIPEVGETDSAGFHIFNQLDRSCRPDRLFAGVNDVLARALHETYVRQQQRTGATPATNPSLVEWERLPKDKQDSNLEQAEHVRTKLATISCEIGPLTDPRAEEFSLTPEEVELLGRMEHERWATHASPSNPLAVPWEELDEDKREIDRNFVRRLPALLATVGYQVNRIER